MDFKCTQCVCPEDEDDRLKLVVTDGVRHTFYIKSNGELDHCDSDGEGQDIYLECQLCGQRYDFESYDLILEEVFALRKSHDRHPFSKKMTKEDYRYKVVENKNRIKL